MALLRTVRATRYATPLREGGSLPAIVEADDLGMYVVKFRGAGQGPAALVAELIGGEIARLLGLPMPEIVFVDVDAALGRNEPDPEIRDLLKASVGLNLALDYLPGSVMFDPAARESVDADLASRIVWLDAFLLNIDRTPQNPNLLLWHRELYLIDHGAALYFQHRWESAPQAALSRFPQSKDHVLLPWADRLSQADEALRPLLSEEAVTNVVAAVPQEWLTAEPAAYVDILLRRLEAAPAFTEEAQRARAQLV
ncbi:MAG: aminotransferase class I and II [Acidobacteria bacterium]|nr:aminotransferase class I and II [Acidobacteriota bacterium]